MTKATDPSLRILAVHRYFWPDTPPYAFMLKRIAERWVRDGHEVHVLTSQPSYKRGVDSRPQPTAETAHGVHITRIRLPNEIGRPVTRIVNALHLFASVCVYALRKGRFDVIMISTSPPVIGGLAALTASRLTRARLLYHCMDIHPEIGRISGEFGNRFVYAVLRKLDSVTCASAARIVVLSSEMRQALESRPGADGLKIEIINNFSLSRDSNEPDTGVPADVHEKRDGCTRILFAGNIGRFQNLGIVLDAFQRLSKRNDIECIFLGDGAALPALQESVSDAGECRIHFVPHQPLDVAQAVIRSADLCLVILEPGIIRFAYPSKTMTYFSEGRPVIAAVEEQSDLARLIRKRKVGYWVAPNDAEQLASVISYAADHRVELEEMGRNATLLARAMFAEDIVLDRWSRLALAVGAAE